MSATQISFASFAAAQLAPATTPSQAELDLSTTKPFAGTVQHMRFLDHRDCAGGWNGHFYSDWQSYGALDATDELPRGSHRALELDQKVMAIGFHYGREF
jgi:hypothetical protein